jgi:hypothetical protein
MFSSKVNAQTELRLIQHPDSRELFEVLDANRKHLRPWHPWIDLIRFLAKEATSHHHRALRTDLAGRQCDSERH